MEQPDIWNQPDEAQALGRERASLEKSVETLIRLNTGVAEARDLLELAREENDQETLNDVTTDVDRMLDDLGGLEFRRMFSGEMDASNAILRQTWNGSRLV